MKCQKCDLPIERKSKYCPHCGHEQSLVNPSFIIGVILSITLFLFLFFSTSFPNDQTSSKLSSTNEQNTTIIDDETNRIKLVREAQQSVFTIFTDTSQGSAFLYDTNGSVVTNAHVVEGSLTATIKTANGKEFHGTVIGYSNEIDVALLLVPELIGQQPFPLEKEKEVDVGQEVIALGTPLGLENSATFGYLTGVNRTFHIPPHTFNNVYQISAPIEPGNSGGPLISVDEEKIIAINSAKQFDADNIAFSIPLHQVTPLINQWIERPMSETEIAALFFDADGNYYYELLWSLFEDYYFDGGLFLNDEDYYYYWLYDDELELWEQYDYDEWYFDYFNNWDGDESYDWDNDEYFDNDSHYFPDAFDDYYWEEYDDFYWDEYEDFGDYDDYWNEYDNDYFDEYEDFDDYDRYWEEYDDDWDEYEDLDDYDNYWDEYEDFDGYDDYWDEKEDL